MRVNIARTEGNPSRMPQLLANLNFYRRIKAHPKATTRQVIEARMIVVDQTVEMRERIIKHALRAAADVPFATVWSTVRPIPTVIQRRMLAL